MPKPDLVILGGPNGSGKSTVADFLLASKSLTRFVNADLIAKGIRQGEESLGDIQSGRIMLASLQEAFGRRESIAFETTLSGRSWAKLLRQAKKLGYEITICFVVVSSADLAVMRVAQRFREGGHSIPESDIRRRFSRSIRAFFEVYSVLSDNWYLFDNSDRSAKLVAYKEVAKELTCYDQSLYEFYQQKSKEVEERC